MDVGRCDDVMVCMMLDVGELFFQFTLMVIIDQREHTDCFGIGILHPLFHQARADQVAERFGSCAVASMFQEPVKFLEEIGFNRNAEADKRRS